MADDKNALPSDREDTGMKPKNEKDPKTSTPPPEDKREEMDPSEQPS